MSTTAEVTKVEDAKASSPGKQTKDDKKKKQMKPKRHNVLIVRENIKFKTLVIQAKHLLKTQFETIELHGIDDQSYLTVSLVA